jgi:hypothetical protein
MVRDHAGNLAPAGPFTGLKVDKKAPAITIIAPEARVYTVNETETANYICRDEGSQVAACNGTAAHGSQMSTSTVGSHLFQVNAWDRVGNRSSAAVTYTVSYGICRLYDPNIAWRIGMIVPIWLHLCDVNGQNVSSPGVAPRAIELVNLTTGSSTRPRGLLPPYDAFSYLPWPAPGGSYGYGLVTGGLQPGLYELRFRAGSDPTVHAVRFRGDPSGSPSSQSLLSISCRSTARGVG